MNKAPDPFDLEKLRVVGKMPVDKAKSLCTKIIEQATFRDTVRGKARRARLLYDIKTAPHSIEVQRIIWEVFMAGTGFRVTNSLWDKHYKNI